MDFDLPPAKNDSPIADLSYRNYTGPLLSRSIRWWIISFAMLRLLKKNIGFWITTGVIVLIHFMLGVQLYFTSNTPQIAQMFSSEDIHHKYAATFFQALGIQGLMVFIIALTVGSGSIAADNKANAMMVYLAKPITKGDYLLGKWMGVFLTLFLTTFGPAFILYSYCLFSYLSKGFLKNEPTLILKIFLACALQATVHASIIVGCSSWSKTPRMANIFYASLYFVSSFVSTIVWGFTARGRMGEAVLIQHLSISGIIQGLAQNLFGVKTPLTNISPPPYLPLLLLAIALCVIGIGAARAKIHAVEVVTG